MERQLLRACKEAGRWLGTESPLFFRSGLAPKLLGLFVVLPTVWACMSQQHACMFFATLHAVCGIDWRPFCVGISEGRCLRHVLSQDSCLNVFS